MTDQELKKYCDAEFENIDNVVSDLLSVVKEEVDDYSTLELAAIASSSLIIYPSILF